MAENGTESKIGRAIITSRHLLFDVVICGIRVQRVAFMSSIIIVPFCAVFMCTSRSRCHYIFRCFSLCVNFCISWLCGQECTHKVHCTENLLYIIFSCCFRLLLNYTALCSLCPELMVDFQIGLLKFELLMNILSANIPYLRIQIRDNGLKINYHTAVSSGL